MKKFLSILCAAIMLAFAACAFAACGDTVAEADVDRLIRKCNKHEVLAVSFESATVTINTDVYSVYIEEIDYGSDVTLDYATSAGSEISMSGDGKNGVSITERSTATAASQDGFLVVGIPERLMESRLLTLSVTSQSGNLQLDDVTATTLTATTLSGTIRLDGCHATTRAKVGTDSGAVYADVEGNSIVIGTKSGDVGFELAARSISVSTTSGSVKGKVDHPEYWYSIDARSNTGKCNLTNRQNGADYVLSVISDTGNINVRFDNDND